MAPGFEQIPFRMGVPDFELHVCNFLFEDFQVFHKLRLKRLLLLLLLPYLQLLHLNDRLIRARIRASWWLWNWLRSNYRISQPSRRASFFNKFSLWRGVCLWTKRRCSPFWAVCRKFCSIFSRLRCPRGIWLCFFDHMNKVNQLLGGMACLRSIGFPGCSV